MSKITSAAGLSISSRDEDTEKVVDCNIAFNGPHAIVLALVVACNSIEARLFCNASSLAVDLPRKPGLRPLGASFLTLDPLRIAFLLESGEISTLDLSTYFYEDEGSFCGAAPEKKGYKNFVKKLKKSSNVPTRRELVVVRMSIETFSSYSSCLVQADEWDSNAGAFPEKIKLVHAPEHSISMLVVSLLNGKGGFG